MVKQKRFSFEKNDYPRIMGLNKFQTICCLGGRAKRESEIWNAIQAYPAGAYEFSEAELALFRSFDLDCANGRVHQKKSQIDAKH